MCEGWADFSLTKRGNKQAMETSKWIVDHYNIDKIYTSTLKRARETAHYLEELTGLSAIGRDNLKEFNNGLRAGLPYEEAYRKYLRLKFLSTKHYISKRVNSNLECE